MMAPRTAAARYKTTTALAKAAGGTVRKRPKNEPGRLFTRAHAESVWWVIAPSSATATSPWMISRAVVTIARTTLRYGCLLEQVHRRERLSRPRAEAIERELRWLARLYVHQDVVVLLLRRLAFPIQVGRIVCGQLDAGPARKDGVLLRAAAAQHQVFHAIDVEYLSGVDVPVQHDNLHI